MLGMVESGQGNLKHGKDLVNVISGHHNLMHDRIRLR